MHLKAHSRSADVTTVTEPRPNSSDGKAPRRPGAPRPPGRATHAGVSLPPEPVDLLLRRFRENNVAGQPRGGPHASPAEPPALSDALASDPSDDPEWTFRPDGAPEPEGPSVAHEPDDRPDEAPTHHRRRTAPRLGVLVIVAALIAGLLAVTHIGPFHSSAPAAATPSTVGAPTDIRGVWNALNAYEGVLYTATMHITSEKFSSGAFSGTITSPVGIETMKGKVLGTTMTFTINLGTGTEKGTAGVSITGAKLRIQGTFTNSNGRPGTIIATRTST